ncbi:MAG: hypothetical protein AAF367_01890 [Pseudomonadota bacterium]
MLRGLVHSIVVVSLTVLTQIGGCAWLAALLFKSRMLAFIALYAVMWAAAVWIAPVFGRTALSCWDTGPLQMQSWLYCGLNRHYVTPDAKALLYDMAEAVDRRFPGTVTLVLDANFPFVTGFPLLPHLSHDDGEKADLAFYYANEGNYIAAATRSPIGYFAFEDGPSTCPEVWPTLRWNLRSLQSLWRTYELDEARTAFLLSTLAKDERVGKILLEPHLKSRLRLSSDKIRFQGCGAARHDDHIHIQL